MEQHVSFAACIEQLMRERKFPFHIAVLLPRISRDEVIEKLEKRAAIRRIKLSISKVSEDTYHLTAKLVKKSLSGYLFTASRDAWFLVSHGALKTTLATIIRHLYPLISMPIISVEPFIGFIRNLTKYYDVKVEQYLLRRRARRETTKGWMHKECHQALKEIAEEMRKKRTVLDAIRLSIASKYYYAYIDLGIERRGIFSIYDGVPDIHRSIVEVLIIPFLELVLEERRKFSKIKRYVDEKTLEPKATVVLVEFPDRIDIQSFTKFVEELSRTHYLSVYCKGNPYLHLLAIDKSSGSAFEVIATSKFARIIPEAKSEVDSLYLILDALHSIIAPLTIKFLE